MSELAVVENSDQTGVDFDQIALDKEQLVTMIIEDQRSCPGAWCKSVALYAAPGG